MHMYMLATQHLWNAAHTATSRRTNPSQSAARRSYSASLTEWLWDDVSTMFQNESMASNGFRTRSTAACASMGWLPLRSGQWLLISQTRASTTPSPRKPKEDRSLESGASGGVSDPVMIPEHASSKVRSSELPDRG